MNSEFTYVLQAGLKFSIPYSAIPNVTFTRYKLYMCWCEMHNALSNKCCMMPLNEAIVHCVLPN